MPLESLQILRLNDFLNSSAQCHAARICYRRGESSPAHGHDFSELFWIESGSAIHSCNKSAENISSGYAKLITKGDVHRIQTAGSEKLRLSNVAFRSNDVNALEENFSARQGYHALSRLSEGVALSGEATEMLDVAMAELMRSDRRGLALLRFLTQFLMTVEYELEKQESNIELPKWLARVMNDAGADSNILASGTSGLASYAERSVDHLNRTCRRYLGLTASGLLNRLRLEHAERLLLTTHFGVTRIALDSGFRNQSYFHRLFKARTGQSPGRYRESARELVGREE